MNANELTGETLINKDDISHKQRSFFAIQLLIFLKKAQMTWETKINRMSKIKSIEAYKKKNSQADTSQFMYELYS